MEHVLFLPEKQTGSCWQAAQTRDRPRRVSRSPPGPLPSPLEPQATGTQRVCTEKVPLGTEAGREHSHLQTLLWSRPAQTPPRR